MTVALRRNYKVIMSALLIDCSVAVVNLLLVCALLTFHPAAPKELAVAVFSELLHDGVVTPTAAHQVTAVESVAVLVALATACTQRSLLYVGLTEIRGVFEINEIVASRSLHVGADRAKLQLPAVDLHKAGAVELLLKSVSYVPEGAHLLPADLHRAGTGHAVTLANKIDFLACGQSTGLIVPQIHEAEFRVHFHRRLIPGFRFRLLLRIHKILRKLGAIVEVLRATAPLEFPFRRLSANRVVASAAVKRSLCASAGDAVHYAGRRNGVNVGCLSTLYFDDVAKYVGVVERRAVPTASLELKLALLDAH